MKDKYTPIDRNYYDILVHYATKRIYAKINYYNEFGGIITDMAVAKDIYAKADEEFLLLAHGKEIRLDKIIALDEHISPNYQEFMDLSCDC